MKAQCPHCGQPVVISGLGRKRVNVGVINICDSLQAYRSVPLVAKELNCTRTLIYKRLKESGLTAKGVIEG